MEFEYKGSHHMLRRKRIKKVTIVGQNKPKKLLANSIQLYFLQLFPSDCTDSGLQNFSIDF